MNYGHFSLITCWPVVAEIACERRLVRLPLQAADTSSIMVNWESVGWHSKQTYNIYIYIYVRINKEWIILHVKKHT